MIMTTLKMCSLYKGGVFMVTYYFLVGCLYGIKYLMGGLAQ